MKNSFYLKKNKKLFVFSKSSEAENKNFEKTLKSKIFKKSQKMTFFFVQKKLNNSLDPFKKKKKIKFMQKVFSVKKKIFFYLKFFQFFKKSFLFQKHSFEKLKTWKIHDFLNFLFFSSTVSPKSKNMISFLSLLSLKFQNKLSKVCFPNFCISGREMKSEQNLALEKKCEYKTIRHKKHESKNNRPFHIQVQFFSICQNFNEKKSENEIPNFLKIKEFCVFLFCEIQSWFFSFSQNFSIFLQSFFLNFFELNFEQIQNFFHQSENLNFFFFLPKKLNSKKTRKNKNFLFLFFCFAFFFCFSGQRVEKQILFFSNSQSQKRCQMSLKKNPVSHFLHGIKGKSSLQRIKNTKPPLSKDIFDKKEGSKVLQRQKELFLNNTIQNKNWMDLKKSTIMWKEKEIEGKNSIMYNSKNIKQFSNSYGNMQIEKTTGFSFQFFYFQKFFQFFEKIFDFFMSFMFSFDFFQHKKKRNVFQNLFHIFKNFPISFFQKKFCLEQQKQNIFSIFFQSLFSVLSVEKFRRKKQKKNSQIFSIVEQTPIQELPPSLSTKWVDVEGSLGLRWVAKQTPCKFPFFQDIQTIFQKKNQFFSKNLFLFCESFFFFPSKFNQKKITKKFFFTFSFQHLEKSFFHVVESLKLLVYEKQQNSQFWISSKKLFLNCCFFFQVYKNKFLQKYCSFFLFLKNSFFFFIQQFSTSLQHGTKKKKQKKKDSCFKFFSCCRQKNSFVFQNQKNILSSFCFQFSKNFVFSSKNIEKKEKNKNKTYSSVLFYFSNFQDFCFADENFENFFQSFSKIHGLLQNDFVLKSFHEKKIKKLFWGFFFLTNSFFFQNIFFENLFFQKKLTKENFLVPKKSFFQKLQTNQEIFSYFFFSFFLFFGFFFSKSSEKTFKFQLPFFHFTKREILNGETSNVKNTKKKKTQFFKREKKKKNFKNFLYSKIKKISFLRFKKSFFHLNFKNFFVFLFFEFQNSFQKIYSFGKFPTQETLKRHLQECKKILQQFKGKKQTFILPKTDKANFKNKGFKKLQKKIQIWCKKNKTSFTKQMFEYCDFILLQFLWSWAKKAHPNKSKNWIRKKYFHLVSKKKWFFGKKTQNSLICLPLHSQM